MFEGDFVLLFIGIRLLGNIEFKVQIMIEFQVGIIYIYIKGNDSFIIFYTLNRITMYSER